jgi:hypothetical protein
MTTRIENRHGGGIPDLHVLWDGMPFWVELKISKSSRVKLSPHQVAWHTSYSARGGLSFFLVKALASSYIHLIRGSEAVDLAHKPLSEVRGSMFEGPAPMLCALRAEVFDHYAGVVGRGPRS